MILEKGNMWDVWGKTDFFCITTNSFINRHDNLAMGKGIALEANKRFKHLSKNAATQMFLDDVNHLGFYGTMIVNTDDWVGNDIMFFQTKYHFNDITNMVLLRKSLHSLFRWILQCPTQRFDLNFPGIGYGGLEREVVLPYIELLPDNVHIWESE